ncbi:uncharacterized protein LOC105685815 isoform X2 [Athalia rosae]|uniref:uncharacterized protein LOC105685815 isoform X2 n=1 Tax=Athalia rosae TaxID=37344 RepID=UPI002033241C|nr:uncharacterized protein LOC105685815 isoform X2 [Athalia rosae]
MWSKRIIKFARSKCIFIILGLCVTQGLGENAGGGNLPGQSTDLGNPSEGSSAEATPRNSSPSPEIVAGITRITKQPFNWEAFPEGEEFSLDEKKKAEVTGNKEETKAPSTLTSPSEGKNLGEEIGTTALPTISRKKNRGAKNGERRRRMKHISGKLSHGNESDSSVSGSQYISSDSNIRDGINIELNNVQPPKKDRSNFQGGRVSRRRKQSCRTNNCKDKKLKDVKDRIKKLRIERRRRRNRERKRKNKLSHGDRRTRKGRKQNKLANEPAALHMPVSTDSEVNVTNSRHKDSEHPKSHVEKSPPPPLSPDQRDEERIFETRVHLQRVSVTTDDADLKTTRDHRQENVEKEFSKQFEKELAKSETREENWLKSSKKLSKIIPSSLSPLGIENLKDSRFVGKKFSEINAAEENELPSDDARYYQDRVIGDILLSKLANYHQIRSTNSFGERHNTSVLAATEQPTLSGEKDLSSFERTLDKVETNVEDIKGDLSCINGTFLPAPLSRHALIKYVKSSTPGHEYLEADYECTKGYNMVTTSRRLLCNNRRWVGEMPKCKLLQNPNDICSDSHCEQLCRDNNGVPTCSCYRGFRQDGNKCIDINECDKDNGGCEFSCINTPGSFRCECPKGMRQGDTKYTCMDINECLLNNGHGPCQDTCYNLEGGYKCSCEGIPGTVLGANNHSCRDAGPCGTNNAGCSHTCLSTMGRVFCLCPDGFMLEDDWKTCQDVDECAVPDLQTIVCEHGCINTPGSYRCAEPPEMRDEPPSNFLLKSCETGFESGLNGENCVDINDIACPALNPSGRGYVICSRLLTPKPWRGRKRVINRPGTKCLLRCPYGYQLRGEYELTCGTNGDWIGSKHGECVRYSKPRLDCPQNIIAEVPPGQSEAFVTFAQPSTDLDWFRYVRSEPSWGTRLEANLLPGEHKVTFIAKHPVSKKQATCTLHISVKPGEAPRIKNCPQNIVTSAKNRTLVTWTEPIFTDNVKITNVISNKNSGHLFSIGDHKIHYEASDEAGWTATCDFLITVKSD